MTISAQCENNGRRLDLNELQPFQRAELNGLIIDFLVSDPNPNWLDTGPDGLNPYNTFVEYKYMIVGEHTQWGDNVTTAANHTNEQFLSWHREYIGKLERYLLDKGYPEYVPLPAWNPTTPLPMEFYNTRATSGVPNLVASNVLVSSAVESVITVPASMIQPGINYFTAEGNGEVVSYEYMSQ